MNCGQPVVVKYSTCHTIVLFSLTVTHSPSPSLPPCCVQLVRNVLTVDYHMSRYKTVVEELQREIAELKTRLAQQGPLKSQFDKTEAARWVVGGASCHANTTDPPSHNFYLLHVSVVSRVQKEIAELQREIAELKTRLAQQGPLKSQFDKTEAARWVPTSFEDVDPIASSVEHHPSLRELTVKGRYYSESFIKGAVEGMARRHGVEKLVVTPYWRGECL